MKRPRAFSLVEVALALGIIAFALVAVVGMIPTGLQASRDAVDFTRTSMIAQDAAMRLPTMAYTSGAPGATAAWFYDQNGHYLAVDPAAASAYAGAFYRVDVARGALNSYPPNTNPANADPSNTYSTQLLAATATITWPLDPTTGLSTGNPSKKVVYPLLTRVMP